MTHFKGTLVAPITVIDSSKIEQTLIYSLTEIVFLTGIVVWKATHNRAAYDWLERVIYVEGETIRFRIGKNEVDKPMKVLDVMEVLFALTWYADAYILGNEEVVKASSSWLVSGKHHLPLKPSLWGRLKINREVSRPMIRLCRNLFWTLVVFVPKAKTEAELLGAIQLVDHYRQMVSIHVLNDFRKPLSQTHTRLCQTLELSGWFQDR